MEKIVSEVVFLGKSCLACELGRCAQFLVYSYVVFCRWRRFPADSHEFCKESSEFNVESMDVAMRRPFEQDELVHLLKEPPLGTRVIDCCRFVAEVLEMFNAPEPGRFSRKLMKLREGKVRINFEESSTKIVTISKIKAVLSRYAEFVDEYITVASTLCIWSTGGILIRNCPGLPVIRLCHGFGFAQQCVALFHSAISQAPWTYDARGCSGVLDFILYGSGSRSQSSRRC